MVELIFCKRCGHISYL